jgi:hypothetical protein
MFRKSLLILASLAYLVPGVIHAGTACHVDAQGVPHWYWDGYNGPCHAGCAK